MAAKRVVTEAQESMSPRLLFLEGPPHSGKTKAASAVLDMPEVRRLWLLRVRGCQPEGSGSLAGAQPLKPFVGVFRQLLGFAEETSWRSRKNATVALLESCGDALDRFGRYAKPILELLELEEPEGYSADGKVRGGGSGSGSQGGGSGAQGWQGAGTSDSGSDKLSDGRLSGFGLALGERTPSFSGASGQRRPVQVQLEEGRGSQSGRCAGEGAVGIEPRIRRPEWVARGEGRLVRLGIGIEVRADKQRRN